MSLPLARRGESIQKDSELASLIDYEAEFDRFVAALIPNVRPPRGAPGRIRTVMTSEAIYEYALMVLDSEGASALTARRLAEDLKISTRTLYKRIDHHDNLIRKVVELHLSKLAPKFSDAASPELTVWTWCRGLHESLCAHPHVTDLMTDEDTMVLVDDVEALMNAVTHQGISRNMAVACCQSLVDVTINDAIREVRASRRSGGPPLIDATGAEAARSLRKTVEWILAGVREESTGAGSAGTFRRDFSANATSASETERNVSP